ncbi:MAG TPA: PqqD family protein [Pyrinomonadaceae bacterium]|nr:PqqD family protein [Pyrinomonadaceae bacterium]
MKSDIFPIARQRDILVQSIKDEVLVYDLKTNKVFCLNETSSIIWQLCDGQNDLTSIAAQFQKESNEQIPLEFIEIALEQLNKENLLENYQPRNGSMNKKSRREMIRKVGLATAMALPIITSIVAPSAVAAASCATGLVFCPASSPFGFPVPAGCYDVQNGYTVPSFPVGIVGCTFCGALCVGTCSSGICMNP